MKPTTILFIGLPIALGFVFLLGCYIFGVPVTIGIGSFNQGFEEGRDYQLILDTPLMTIKKEISILAEKKSCLAQGGVLEVVSGQVFINPTVGWDSERVVKSIKCTKPITQTLEDGTKLSGTKELFRHEF